jgi:hypothetical protein
MSKVVRLGVNIVSDKPVIEKWEAGLNYNYVFICEEVYFNNGNGRNRLKVCDNNDNYLVLEKNNWVIQPVIESPFNWSGSCINPILKDPNGIAREIYKDGYSQSIFKGLSFARDVNAVFDCLDEYSSFKNWQEFDLKKLREEKDLIINKLKKEITSLKERIKKLEEGE